jgi:hypothetical protein
MLQFYLLSVVLNICSGFALYSEKLEDGKDKTNDVLVSLKQVFRDSTLRLVLGILTSITGFFKLVSVTPGDVPIVGDLVPALAGLALGFILLLEFSRGKSTAPANPQSKLDLIFLHNRTTFGIIGMIVGFVHFLFASVLFL